MVSATMTVKDEETGASSKSMPVLEESVSKSGENGAGDTALVPRKAKTTKDSTPDKLSRPKNFKPLTVEEEKLIKCCEEGKIDEIRVLLKNKKLKVDCLDDSGTTPLEHACYKGNLELVELLLAAGANVNNNMQTQGYTPLMFASLAGKLDVVKTLLHHGARTSTTNNIGKNAAQLAGFVGNHAIAISISNFFTVEDLDYYTVPHGLETEGKLPANVAPTLHRYIMQTNLHPVKLIYFIRSNPIIFEEAVKILRTMEAIIEKEVKSREMNEIMAMKIHYYSEVIRHVKKMTADGKSFDDIIKVFVRGRNSKGFPEYLEDFLRRSIRSFPYHQTPLHSTMVHAIAKANLGGASGSMSILEQSINGQHMPGRDGAPCDTCCDPDARKKCSACKMVSYCNEECQKMHWPVHKKECSQLALQFVLMEKRKVEEEARVRQEEEERRLEEARNELAVEEEKENDGKVPEGNALFKDPNCSLDSSASPAINVDDVGISVRDDDARMHDTTDKTALLADTD